MRNTIGVHEFRAKASRILRRVREKREPVNVEQLEVEDRASKAAP
jgi:hypothetical protein